MKIHQIVNVVNKIYTTYAYHLPFNALITEVYLIKSYKHIQFEFMDS